MFTARKSRLALAGGAALVAVLVLGGCASSNPLDTPTESSGSSDDTIVIGSQAYYSNEIIAEIYAQALENADFKVDRKFSIGQRDAYMPDVESGAIDLFPEYTGSLLEYLDKNATATSPEDVYTALKEALPEGLTALEYAEASDQDTYTVLKSFAEANDLTSIGDLAKVATPVTIGAAPEFEERPYGPAKAKEAYGVDLTFSATSPTPRSCSPRSARSSRASCSPCRACSRRSTTRPSRPPRLAARARSSALPRRSPCSTARRSCRARSQASVSRSSSSSSTSSSTRRCARRWAAA